ncbi:hypothetical protein ILUMI_05246 [Ignelater luminosus]|uniref:Uncharacterized protein n=1 Tax=Ignelater luminosus TaxID=2038154 RepID=A0A8K0GKA5_IGNLU|nr:hypothetical protein ILUMI_05246 [Ignelater luminosus]
MGSAISCGKCPTVETSSVINLSDALILRMLEGIEVPGPTRVAVPEDEDWFEKLKCIDDAHSNAYGLTFRDLSSLVKAVEKRIKDGALTDYCPSDVVGIL